MPFPTFVVAGVPKAGTTTLYHYFKSRTDVFVPKIKETRFFEHKDAPNPIVGKYARYPSVTKESDYLALFEDAGSTIAIGEVTPTYFYSTRAPKLIREYNPSMKIVVLLRDPISRAFSNYTMLLGQGREELSFRDALEAEDNRISEGWSVNYHYKSVGLYGAQLAQYLQYFSPSQILLADYRDMRRDSDGFFSMINAFIGISGDYDFDIRSVHNKGGVPKNKLLSTIFQNPFLRSVKSYAPSFIKNSVGKIRESNTYMPSISPADYEYLQAYFAADVQTLRNLSGKPFFSDIWAT